MTQHRLLYIAYYAFILVSIYTLHMVITAIKKVIKLNYLKLIQKQL